jgi:hypothetical protein
MPERKDVPGEITGLARDAIHVAVGLGLLGLHRAQLRRQELTKRLTQPKGRGSAHLTGVRGMIKRQMQAADEAAERMIVRAEASLEPVEDRLPSPVREIVKQAHARSREAHGLLRSIVRGTAA